MEGTKLSRRQFLGGTAAVAAASVLPAGSAAAPAMATPAGKLPDRTIFGTWNDATNVWTTAPTVAWKPLDAKAAARHGYEIYRGMHSGVGQSG